MGRDLVSTESWSEQAACSGVGRRRMGGRGEPRRTSVLEAHGCEYWGENCRWHVALQVGVSRLPALACMGSAGHAHDKKMGTGSIYVAI